MIFRSHELDGNNLTLYQTFENKQVTLKNHGTLDNLVPNEEPRSSIIIPQGSLAVRVYGIGFLKNGIEYEIEKIVNLDDITAIAGYGTFVPWEDFVRAVGVERLKAKLSTQGRLVT